MGGWRGRGGGAVGGCMEPLRASVLGMFAPSSDTVLLGLWRQESRDEIKP